jgi:hypothetical protein
MSDEAIRIETPAEVDVILSCPQCGHIEAVGAKLRTRLVLEQGSASKLSLRARALPLEHACGQLALEAPDSGA